MSPISSVSSGLLAASNQFTQASLNTLAAANGLGAGGQGALPAAIVGQAQAGVQLQAAAQVTKVADQMTATLLDITA